MKEFNKLSIDEQRKFIINKIISDKYFCKIVNNVKDNYCEYILEGDELVKYKLELNNRRNAMHIMNALKNYEHTIDKVMAEHSRYKDIVYDVYSCKETIEAYCKSKYINGMNRTYNSYYNSYYIFYDIIYCYYNTLNKINKYGGETDGDENQSLSKAIKYLLNNPYLCDEIKNDKKYKQYYDTFYNKKNVSSDSSDGYDSSDDDTEDIVSADEVELSDIENNTEGSDDDNDTDDADDSL
jgi:hypothetical protein